MDDESHAIAPRHPGAPRTRRESSARRRSDVDALNEIRDHHEELLYEAMCNAPAGAVNLPMLDRATEVIGGLRRSTALNELAVLDPEVAATQMPAARCREYSGALDLAVWLVKFIAACDARRQAETPTLSHLRQ